MKDVEILKNKGLAQGGTINNVLVFNQKSTVNKERFLHEALYHKVLDLMGDLSLCGRPIQGHLLGSKGGHALDVAFAKKLMRQEQEFRLPDSMENQMENQFVV
jgi:UDP-3-O-[3-hydroxymyristoyl] N-acetylglucosamine deacetylase